MEKTTKTSSCTVTMFCAPQPAARGPAFLMTLVSGIHQGSWWGCPWYPERPKKLMTAGMRTKDKSAFSALDKYSEPVALKGQSCCGATCQHVSACYESLQTSTSGYRNLHAAACIHRALTRDNSSPTRRATCCARLGHSGHLQESPSPDRERGGAIM